MAKNVTSFCPMSIEMGFTSFLFRWFAIATVVVRSPHRKVVDPTSAGAPLGFGMPLASGLDGLKQITVQLTLFQPRGV